MNKNEYFGARRNRANLLEDFGYMDMAFASGTQESLNTAQANLTSETATLIALKNGKIKLQNELGVLRSGLASWKSAYDNCNNTSCKAWNSARTCTACRQPKLDKIAQLSASIKSKEAEIRIQSDKIAVQNNVVTGLQESIKALVEAINQEALAETTLATQGLTSEAVLQQAQADAVKIVKDAETLERQSKSKKIIIVSIILSAVLLTGIWAFYKIKKKA
jgi:hypothetical protein